MRLAYSLLGTPSKPAMVLLHGMGSQNDRRSWNPVIPLLQSNFQIVAVDLRGHGQSPRAESYRLSEMAEDIAELLDSLEIKDPVVIGCSMGGIVALNLAYQRPDLVRALVVEDSPMPPPTSPDAPIAVAQAGVQFRSATADDYDSVERPLILGDLMRPNPDWSQDLSAMTMPTLVFGGGSRSEYVDQAQLTALADALPFGEFIEIPVGHNIHADAPEAFADALFRFLKVGCPIEV